MKCASTPSLPLKPPPSLAICKQPRPDDPPESDVSVDRRAARGHETLDKGHACPFAGKSSMHLFPAIVLQPGALISLVQVEPFPSYSHSLALAHLCFPFDSDSVFSLLGLSTSHSSRFLAELFLSSSMFLFTLSHLPLSHCFSGLCDNRGIQASR